MSHILPFVLTLCLISLSLFGFAKSETPPVVVNPPQIDEINVVPLAITKITL